MLMAVAEALVVQWVKSADALIDLSMKGVRGTRREIALMEHQLDEGELYAFLHEHCGAEKTILIGPLTLGVNDEGSITVRCAGWENLRLAARRAVPSCN